MQSVFFVIRTFVVNLSHFPSGLIILQIDVKSSVSSDLFEPSLVQELPFRQCEADTQQMNL